MKLKFQHLFAGIAALLLFHGACAAANPVVQIFPQPAETVMLKGKLKVSGASIKCDPRIDSLSMVAINRFAASIGIASGKVCSLSSPMGIEASVENESAKGIIFLLDRNYDKEEYSISVGKRAAVIKASGSGGFIPALQTLCQMLPESIYGKALAENDKWYLPCCEIHDKPQNAERTMLLDCSEYYLSTDCIKNTLELMSIFKLNRLVWQLSGDLGWRVEIKAYPMLTQMGSWREEPGMENVPEFSSHKRYGGYYSRSAVKEIVNYAAGLGIEVIPFVNLSEHCLPVLSAYPALSCDGREREITREEASAAQSLCMSKPEAVEFVTEVAEELALMFNSNAVILGSEDFTVADDILRIHGKARADIPGDDVPAVTGATPENVYGLVADAVLSCAAAYWNPDSGTMDSAELENHVLLILQNTGFSYEKKQ